MSSRPATPNSATGGTDYHLVEATVVKVADVEPKLVPPMMRLGSAVAGVNKVLRMGIAAKG